MDIICAKCGKHFSSIEAAREHYGHCSASSNDEEIHWLPAKKSTKNEWIAKDRKELTRDELKKLNELAESIRKKYQKKESEKKPPFEETTIIQKENHTAIIEEAIPESNAGVLNNQREPAANIKTDNITTDPDFKKQSNFRYWKTNFQLYKWTLALLLVFICVFIGFGVSAFTGTYMPLWLLIGFSIIFTIENWYYYQTRKNVHLGRIYKTFLNISFLSIFGLCIWSGIQVFSKQFFQSQLIGCIIFIAEIICLIWLITVLNRNKHRRPSMKITAFSLLCLFIIFAFAGVQPFEQYKDSAFSAFSNWISSIQSDKQENGISSHDNSASESNQNIITETILNPKWWSGTDEKSITNRSQELFELTNEKRINSGLSPLQRNTQLDKLAQEKAESMDKANVQTGLTHSGFEERASIAQSIGFNTVAENIAYGGFEASSFIDMWMGSPLHKANMLDRRFTHIGIGVYGKYAVQFFGQY